MNGGKPAHLIVLYPTTLLIFGLGQIIKLLIKVKGKYAPVSITHLGSVSYIMHSTEVLFYMPINAEFGIYTALLHLLFLKYLYSYNNATVRFRGFALLRMRQELY
jgi:hypothetical protein